MFPFDGVEILKKYERIAHIEGAEEILQRLGDVRQQAQGARGELLRVEELVSQGVEVIRVSDVKDKRQAADIVIKGNIIEDTKDYGGRNWEKYPDFLVKRDIEEMRRQVKLRREQYPGAQIRYVFFGPVHPDIVKALQDLGVTVIFR